MSVRSFAVAVAALCALTAAAGKASASESDVIAWLYEVKAGLLYHDMDHMWSGSRREDGVDFNGELIFAPKFAFLGGAFRGALGASLNSNGDTSKAYLDLRYMYEFLNGIFLSAGSGGAVHNGDLTGGDPDKKALGTRFLFHTALEGGYRFAAHHAVSVYFDHISNAGLADHNQGLDTLGLRYGYRFTAGDAVSH